MRRQPNEHVYSEGHGVAMMAILARTGGEVTFTRAELERANGMIVRHDKPRRVGHLSARRRRRPTVSPNPPQAIARGHRPHEHHDPDATAG